MTHDEAVVQCERRNAEPYGPFRRWRPRRRRDGDWDVVVHISPEATRPREDVRATTQASRADDRPDDPRSAFERNVGGPYAGG